jgi:hypothetical protein
MSPVLANPIQGFSVVAVTTLRDTEHTENYRGHREISWFYLCDLRGSSVLSVFRWTFEKPCNPIPFEEAEQGLLTTAGHQLRVASRRFYAKFYVE